MTGYGQDIIDVLTARTNVQRQEIIMTYKREFGRVHKFFNVLHI